MKTVLNLWKKVGMWFVLIVLLLIFTIISPAFRTANNFGNILKQISILGVAAVGISFVLISGSVDLSIGAIIALEIVVMAKMLQAKIPLGFVIVAGLLIAAVCSTINGLLANTLKIPAFTITLATMNIYQGVAWLISGGKVLGGFLTSKISIFATKYLFKFFPLMGVILIVSAIIGIYLLSKTYFGRYVYAIGGNAEAARLAGINTKKTTIEIHIIAGIFYGIAGILYLSRTMSATGSACANYAFQCITAACLGGVSTSGGEGKASGAILGVLVIGIFSNGMGVLGVNDFVQQVIQGGILLFALFVECLQGKVVSVKDNAPEAVVRKEPA